MKPINATLIKCGYKSGLFVAYDSSYAYDSVLPYDNPFLTAFESPTNAHIKNIESNRGMVSSNKPSSGSRRQNNPLISLVQASKPSNAKII